MSKDRKKVLFFLPGGVGGAERITLKIGKMLPKEDYEVKFVIVGTKTNILNVIPEGYEVIRLKLHNIYCAPVIRISWLIMREKPDFAFSSIMYLNVIVLISSRLNGVKCIVRNDNHLDVVNSLTIWKLKLTYPYAYHIIAQQEEMAKNLITGLHLDADKMIVRHNPLDTNEIDYLAKGPSPFPEGEYSTKYLWIGNFNMNKGHDILVRAFKIVHEIKPNAKLYLIGTTSRDTTFFDSVRDYVNKNQLTDCVHFLGFQANPYPYIKHCDCYVLPSRREGLPNSLIEAMYLKRPVVATRCIPIISRMIQEGENGYTVEVESPQEMAEKMIKALELKNPVMTFKPDTPESFIELFT